MASEARIAAALEELARGRGVLRHDLAQALQGELSALRECWSLVIPGDAEAALEFARHAVAGNLRLLINRLESRRANQHGFTPDERLTQYRNGIKVYFNLLFPRDMPEYLPLQEMDLTHRRGWLSNEAPKGVRISVSAGQDDQAHAVQQIASMIASAGYSPVQIETPLPLASDQAIRFPPRLIKSYSLIPRPEYGPQLSAAATPGEHGYPVICIWGEPGTGKTTLAHDFLRRQLDSGASSPFVATLRAADPVQLHEDMTALLAFEGLEPTTWSAGYCKAQIRQWFAHDARQPLRTQAIVIDNVADEDLIDQLVPNIPGVPFWVTMRSKPRNPRATALQLGNFTEPQSIAFVQGFLGSADEVTSHDLYKLLGGRPLALDHAVRFVRESPDVSLSDVVELLKQALADGLGLVADPMDQDGNLVTLYKPILAQLVENENVRYVLDRFLAVAGQSGTFLCDEFYLFLSSSFGDGYSRVRFRSALRVLGSYGLAQELINPLGDSTILTIHPLTFAILRELRSSGALLFAEAEYYRYLSSLVRTIRLGGVENLFRTMQSGQSYVSRIACSMYLAQAFAYLHINSSSPLKLPDEFGDNLGPLVITKSHGGEPSILFRGFEARLESDDTLSTLDGATGEWLPMSNEELQRLLRSSLEYRSYLYEFIQGQLDDPNMRAVLASQTLSTDEQHDRYRLVRAVDSHIRRKMMDDLRQSILATDLNDDFQPQILSPESQPPAT